MPVKAIPGASRELVERLGFLADRMSINLELPTADGLKALAPRHEKENIRAYASADKNSAEQAGDPGVPGAPRFVPAGQSTQMIMALPGDRLSDYPGSPVPLSEI